MNLFFDTETTGLPVKDADWETDYLHFPYLASISWKRSDQDRVKTFIIKPEGYEIPQDVVDIHGITTEIALEKGIPFTEIIHEFISDCYKAEKIIGHNLYFDTSITKANVMRHIHQRKLHESYKEAIIHALDKKKRIDTMFKTIKFCAIPKPNGYYGYKWPKLTELYYVLFNERFEAHSSHEDVLATEKCFNELISRNIITL